MQKVNREVIANKMREHFGKIRRVIDGFEQKMVEKLETLENE